MRHTLLCTVGTSLFNGNLKQLNPEKTDLPTNWQELRQAYQSQSWKKLARELSKCDPSSRICGAEINALEQILTHKNINLERLIFFVSDTDLGINTGKVLKEYFKNRKDLNLRYIESVTIKDLQDKDPKRFAVSGLRNLVQKMGDEINKAGGHQFCAIEATGGYKAQIAIAVIVGQALQIPVYYKHENFSTMIDFPPLPVGFDYSILGDNAHILRYLEQGNIFSWENPENLDPRLKVLLTETEIDGKLWYELSPIGQIYLTGFRIRYPKVPDLVPCKHKKPPTFGNDHHFPPDFKKFVKKIWNETPWIKTAYTLPYAGQKGIKGNWFKVEKEGNSQLLIGMYRKKDFGAKFRIRLSKETHECLTWAADQLNRQYGEFNN